MREHSFDAPRSFRENQRFCAKLKQNVVSVEGKLPSGAGESTAQCTAEDGTGCHTSSDRRETDTRTGLWREHLRGVGAWPALWEQ